VLHFFVLLGIDERDLLLVLCSLYDLHRHGIDRESEEEQSMSQVQKKNTRSVHTHIKIGHFFFETLGLVHTRQKNSKLEVTLREPNFEFFSVAT
jgi:hypothetical protein